MTNISAIVLAAGRGTRMNSTNKNKVTLEISKKPLISHTINNIKQAGIQNIVVVVGFAKDSVEKILKRNVIYAHQKKRLGTGHAVKSGINKLPTETNMVLVMYGDDSAFYTPAVFQKLISHHQNQDASVTLLTIKKDNPTSLGRIIRGADSKIKAIVEEKNASPKEKKIKEINTGLYCFDKIFLEENIKKIQKNPISNEYYLTDIIKIAVDQKKTVEALLWHDENIWHGVNNYKELKDADQLMIQKDEASSK